MKRKYGNSCKSFPKFSKFLTPSQVRISTSECSAVRDLFCITTLCSTLHQLQLSVTREQSGLARSTLATMMKYDFTAADNSIHLPLFKWSMNINSVNVYILTKTLFHQLYKVQYSTLFKFWIKYVSRLPLYVASFLSRIFEIPRISWWRASLILKYHPSKVDTRFYFWNLFGSVS